MAARSPVIMPLRNFDGEDLRFYRSGSAPPTVEGSLNAINDLNSSEILSNPDYPSYYYNSVTRNPRMPPPVLSKEDWRSRQRLGGIEHNRSLSQNLGVNSTYNNGGNDNEWVSRDGLLGLSLPKQESLTEFLQDNTSRSTSNPKYSFLLESRNAYETDDVNRYSETRLTTYSDRSIHNLAALQNKTSQSFASVVTPLPLNRNNNYHTSELVESENLVAALGGLNLSNGVSEINAQQTFLRELRNAQGQVSRSLNPAHSLNSSLLGSSNSSNFPSHAIKSRFYPRGGGSAASLYRDYDTNELNGYSIHSNLIPTGNLPPLLENAVNASSIAAFSPQTNVMDPEYIQYLKMLEYANLTEQSYFDLLRMRQYDSQFLGNNDFNINTSYPSKPVRQIEHHLNFNRGMTNYFGGGTVNGSIKEGFPSSRLEEFKINKTKCLELSNIAGSVVEFSMDQVGSRFIQHKLDTASVEEINMLFKEIMPHALALMTDVFGNYVIQKFLEHGSSQQIRELTSKLYTNVLDLSLQMYGCRVIQKAIEIVDLDQQTKMVAELDGHIMRCVRDQNGNHVIQRCIQCIPEEAIQFIISSFYDNIITLSTHPYGCRVIQRVLEHCNDPKTQKIVVDEVMKCVCMLAWDQYGNYVVQHVVEHGKPRERSAIIKQLAGQIVQMSQQKYASNVVEKCLIFSSPDERQTLVNQMLGTTDDNEPLQAMMKDQFGNYVVQKVLETCNDQQRQLILSRIKVHLSALKKYTYGKHIVARVEKLLAAGERRNALQSANPSNMA